MSVYVLPSYATSESLMTLELLELSLATLCLCGVLKFWKGYVVIDDTTIT